jgi:ADP-heptose:LPS heptosyltransferase
MKTGQSQRPLVVRFGALGDMVLLTTLIRHLHARFGQPVDILASGGWTRPLLQDQPGVGDIYVIRSRNTPYWLSSEQRELVKALRTRGPSATWLCDHKNDKTHQLLCKAGWQERHWCHYSGLSDLPGRHFCDMFLRYAYRNPPILGGDDLPLTATDTYSQLHVTNRQITELQQWLTKKSWHHQQLILVQVGNKRTMRKGFRQRASNTKYWPEENWAQVLRGLRAMHPEHVILMLGVPQEVALNDEIMQLAHIDKLYNIAHELPLPRLIALSARAVGMVSVDTGPAHLAAAAGCRVVTLFGAVDPAMYAPRGPRGSAVCLQGDRNAERPMQTISPDAVLEAWRATMSTSDALASIES